MRSASVLLSLRRYNSAATRGFNGSAAVPLVVSSATQRRSIEFESVGTEKKITESDINRQISEKGYREHFEKQGYAGDDLELQVRAALDFKGDIGAALQVVRKEKAEAERANVEKMREPTKVVFNEQMAAKLIKVKMEGGVVHERARKKAAELQKGAPESMRVKLASPSSASLHGREGHRVANLDSEVSQYVYETMGSTANEGETIDAVEFLQAPSTTSAAKSVVPTPEAQENLSSSLEAFVERHELGTQASAGDVSLEMTLKYIYEGRRNDPELVSNAMQSLTRTLYEKRYAGPLLAKEATLEAKYYEPGSPTAVLSSTKLDAELLGGDVLVNENLQGKQGVGEKEITMKEASRYKKMAQEKLELDLEKNDGTSRALKPLSEFSPRERKNYAKAVQEMTWIEEWAVQEIIIAFNEAESKFEGSAEEYRAQLERVRDTIHESVLNKVDQAVNERLAGKPLAYILGSTPFLDTEILCDPPVMCPRVETEHWVGWLTSTLSRVAIEELTPKPTIIDKSIEILASNAAQFAISLRNNLFNDSGARYNPDDYKKRYPVPEDPTLFAHNKIDVLDLCCGSGNIGIAIAKAIVGANVVALDVLPEAVTLSRRNAMHNRIPKWKYRAEESDFFSLVVHNALFRANVERAKKEEELARRSAAANGSQTSASSSTALSTQASSSREEKESIYIPPLDQLPQIIDENELHATMHFLSKANADKEPMLPVTYDLIVCNPPCVHPDDFKATVDANAGIEWESELAIVGDPRRRNAQQLYYRDLCILGHKFSKPVGKRPAWIPKSCPSIAFEVGIQGAVVANLFTQSKLWDNVTLHVDGDRMPRWITAVRKDFDW